MNYIIACIIIILAAIILWKAQSNELECFAMGMFLAAVLFMIGSAMIQFAIPLL